MSEFSKLFEEHIGSAIHLTEVVRVFRPVVYCVALAQTAVNSLFSFWAKWSAYGERVACEMACTVTIALL